MLKKISEYLLYLTVFLLPLQTRWIVFPGELNGAYFEYASISLYAVDILIIAMLLFVFGDFFAKRFNDFDIKDYWWILAAFEFSVFVSIIFSFDKLVSFYGYFKFLLGIGLFYLVVNYEHKRLKLIYYFLTGVFLEALLGIWQFLSQSTFSTKWLGLASHDPAVLGTSVIETSDGMRWLRAYGGLDHPNMLGGLLVVGIIMLILLLIQNRKSEAENPKQFQNPKSNPQNSLLLFKIKFFTSPLRRIKASYFLLFIFLLSLFFTFSRGAWIAFLFGIAAMFALSVLKKDLLVQRKLLSVILLSGIIFFALFNIYDDLVYTRLSGGARLEVKSNTERIESYQVAKRLIENHWFFGVGVGNYPIAVEKEIQSGEPAYFYQPVHNVFLLVWAEIGIIGLLFFAGFIFYIFYFLISDCFKIQGKNIYLIALPAAMMPAFMVDHWWWSLHFGVLFFWFVSGLLLQKKEPGN